MEQPLVSVIIPIYNMEKFIAETIESVMQTTYANFEVILVDDGSTDQSADIARKYAEKDDNIKFYAQKNGGAAAARNHAIRKSKGIYILPVDAEIGRAHV